MKIRAWSKSVVPTVFSTLLALFIASCGSGSEGGDGVPQTPVTDQTLWYVDNDGDGFGSSTDAGAAKAPEGEETAYATNNLDCNDEAPDIHPMATEQADDIDHNCNGESREAIVNGVIPDTGQTKSYTDTFGEDSDFLICAPSYTKLDSDGSSLPEDAPVWSMVEDTITGLTWEVKQNADGQPNTKDPHDADNTSTWSDASQVHISGLNTSQFGGFDDWRLPSITELLYLAKSLESPPFIDTHYLTHASSQKVWSRSENSQQANFVWSFDPMTGLNHGMDNRQTAVVWAVRGESKASVFVNRGFGVIEDTTNGLMWQQKTGRTDEGKAFSWTSALKYCNSLTLSGYTDWRLPNRHELASLVDHAKKDPAILSDLFPDTEGSAYLTSTRYNSKDVTLIDFKYGQLSFTRAYHTSWVRAVRGGNNVKVKTWYLDSDADGYGNAAIFREVDSTKQLDGYALNGEDCRDNDATIHPGAPEIPDDGIDQDCSGKDLTTWYADQDQDGFGALEMPQTAETQPAGYVANSEDCNDANGTINPAMADLKDDGIDNNCNGLQVRSWYLDEDGDGFGSGDVLHTGDTPPPGEGSYSTNNLDCASNDPTINPSRIEIYGDAIDSNCNGESDDPAQQIIPDTGQTRSYTATPGEDSDTTINPPSFTKLDASGNDLDVDAESWVAVRDNVTGLIWEVKTEATKRFKATYQDAEVYCSTLSLAGFSSGWRVPTARELAFITHADRHDPAVDLGIFPDTLPDNYWTATPASEADPGTHLTIDFQYGTSNRVTNFEYHIRAVHSGTLPVQQALTNLPNDTTHETATGLVWQTNAAPAASLAEAHAACDDLALDGMHDWRLPSKSDLAWLRTCDTKTRIDAFGSSSAYHWTSSLLPDRSGKADSLAFDTGTYASDIPSALHPFRAVRGQKVTHFTANGNGTATDIRTGLMWQVSAAGAPDGLTWPQALNYCNSLNTETFAGYDDWRLPTRNELLSLLGESPLENEAINETFTDMPHGFWSSTASDALINFAWQVNFSEMQERIALSDVNNTNRVRVVRGGKIESP